MSNRRCRWCRKKFPSEPRGRPAVYCSRSCRQRAYDARRPDPALRALKADIHEIKRREEIRKTILAVLGELKLIAPIPRPRLRLVGKVEADFIHKTVRDLLKE